MQKAPKYYKIRVNVFWSVMGGIILCAVALGFRNRIAKSWQAKEKEVVSYKNLQSQIDDIKTCYLCGSSNRSLMEYYRKFDTIGIIELNDWWITDFGIRSFDDEGKRILGDSNTSSSYVNTEYMTLSECSEPGRGKASMSITLPESHELNTQMIQNHLCQDCLDRVTASLSTQEYENKATIPLCLVDFQTLEIYSLQEGHTGCSIRDFWIDIYHDENIVEIKAYDLPER